MGVEFSSKMDMTLTESQKQKAKNLGISEDEMLSRIIRVQNREKPEISVIIPVYNGEKYIKYAIDSVFSQKYNSYEIIVIDDGSTDETLDILTQYDGLTVLIKPNGGTASALNTGIRNSKGNWIKWLSADDVLLPEYLDEMMKHISSIPNNKDKIFYTNYEIIDDNGDFINYFLEPPSRNFTTNKEQFEELMRYFYGNGSSSFIHKSVFERIGMFDDSLKHSEDYDFWLKASKNNIRFELVPNCLLKYRRHKDQLTNKIGGSLDEKIKARYR